MAKDLLTVLALADTMLASERNLASLVAACDRVFGRSLPWAPKVCVALLERTGDNFYFFSRHEIAHILLQLLGRGSGDAGNDEHSEEDGEEDADVAAPPAFVALPPVRRYCIEPPIRPAKEAWLAP